MDKKGSEHIVCTVCSDEAIPGTNPPVCKKHLEDTMHKDASVQEPKTLKELDSNEAEAHGRE